MKKVVNINQSWLFSKTLPENFGSRPENAELVNLPHSFNSFDGQDGRDYFRGKCVYQKEINVPDGLDNISIFLEFLGVNSVAEVYVNGEFAKKHAGGYSAFRVEITDFINFGEINVISVTSDNSENDEVYPIFTDYTVFGGIHRDVNLIISEKSHFALDDFGGSGIYINTKFTDANGKVFIKALVTGPLSYDIVNFTVIDSHGATAGSANVNPKDAAAVIDVGKPDLWNGRKAPNLYHLRARLLRDNIVLDQADIKFGFRSIEEKGGNIYFNGENLFIKAVAKPQDRENCGFAVNEAQTAEDIRCVKEIGANAVKASCFQHSRDFYDICDREGLLVFTEIPFVGALPENDAAKENLKQQLIEIIKQNYNHPSVCFWGLCSNIAENCNCEELYTFLSELNGLAKSLDKSRLTVFTAPMGALYPKECNYVTDVMVYTFTLNDEADPADYVINTVNNYRQDPLKKKIMVSTPPVEGTIKYQSASPVHNDCSEEYQALFHERISPSICESDIISGSIINGMFEYADSGNESGGMYGVSNSGFVTYDRKIKKDAFHFYRSQWSGKKFNYIAGRRLENRAENKTDVKVYSNCRKITLTANNKEIKRRPVSGIPGVYIFSDIKLKKGPNVIKTAGDESFFDEIVINRVKNPDENYIFTAAGNIKRPPAEEAGPPETPGEGSGYAEKKEEDELSEFFTIRRTEDSTLIFRPVIESDDFEDINIIERINYNENNSM
ncbi:MAG: hypothetical protein FWF08_06785 [Oscillospiraceae bacterium]|nr:hypothetical protein [Oscillospiraceae bacterium]